MRLYVTNDMTERIRNEVTATMNAGETNRETPKEMCQGTHGVPGT